MAFALLTPHARQLKALGLKFLVTPSDCPYSPCAIQQVRPAQARPEARSTVQSAAGTRYTPPPRPVWNRDARPGQNAGQRQQVQGNGRLSGQTYGQGQGQPPSQPHAVSYAQAQAGPAANTAAAATARPPENWPDDWQKLLARTKPGRIAWTYTDLGYDLSGFASPERRKYLQELLAFMRLPKGSSTFWPIGLPQKGSDGTVTLNIRPDLFWAGIAKLGIRHIIFLGSDAAAKAGCAGIPSSHGCLILTTQEDINSFADAQAMNTAKNIIKNWIWTLPGA